jgi:hypothetical protein
MPSLRLIQAPVFHGYSFSLWVEFESAPDLSRLIGGLEAARTLARDLARQRGLTLGVRELGALVEALGCDAARIEAEIEKLSLFAGPGGKVTLADLEALTPDARTATLFSLVNALGRSDRLASLHCLDTLVKEGEYLPLALSFLGAQFRLALAAHASGARNAHDHPPRHPHLARPRRAGRPNPRLLSPRPP